MAINYCDFTNGNDSTGNGTYSNPYQTITQASIGLSGGDEVRVAKSLNSTNLPAVLNFVDGASSIISSVSLAGSLSPGDFLFKTGEQDFLSEVTSIASTTINIYKPYRGTTESANAQKLGVTDTGGAAAATTPIQTISSSGSSITSKIKISGGWDLSLQSQTGYTYFRQTTTNSRYGYGLYSNNKDNIEVEKLGFLRYNDGIHLLDNENNILNDIKNYCCERGIYLYQCSNFTCDPIICDHHNNSGIYLDTNCFYNNLNDISLINNQYGIYISDYGSHNNLTSITSQNNTSHGIYFDETKYNNLHDITCNNNVGYGIYLNNSDNNIINSPNCNNNSLYGINCYTSVSNIVDNYAGTGNSSGDVNVGSVTGYQKLPSLKMQHYRVLGDNRCYYLNGITYRNTTEARSTQCLRYTPTSNLYYIKQTFGFTGINVEKSITFYIKDNTSFNGDVQAALFFMGKKIAGWTTIIPTTSYVQHTLVGLVADITEDGVVELHIKVRGTAGDVYIDDLGVI